jgi:hypothetical protein
MSRVPQLDVNYGTSARAVCEGFGLFVTLDGRTVVYNVGRYLTDLYLVEGLKVRPDGAVKVLD